MAWQNLLLSPNIKPGRKPRSVQAFCRFPWEQSDADELAQKARDYRITPAEEAELNRMLHEWEAAQAAKKEKRKCQR